MIIYSCLKVYTPLRARARTRARTHTHTRARMRTQSTHISFEKVRSIQAEFFRKSVVIDLISVVVRLTEYPYQKIATST